MYQDKGNSIGPDRPGVGETPTRNLNEPVKAVVQILEGLDGKEKSTVLREAKGIMVKQLEKKRQEAMQEAEHYANEMDNLQKE